MEKKTEKINNNCLECAYCAKHYVNLNGRFQAASCMHCINSNMTVQARRKRTAGKAKCEYWKPAQIQIDKRRQEILHYLRITADRLNEIAYILKEDGEHKNSP